MLQRLEVLLPVGSEDAMRRDIICRVTPRQLPGGFSCNVWKRIRVDKLLPSHCVVAVWDRQMCL